MTKNWYENIWFVRLKVLVVSAFFAAFGNWIFTSKAGAPVTPLEAAPALIVMICLVLFAMVVQMLFERIPKWPKLPTALYLTIINTFIGCDLSPVQGCLYPHSGLCRYLHRQGSGRVPQAGRFHRHRFDPDLYRHLHRFGHHRPDRPEADRPDLIPSPRIPCLVITKSPARSCAAGLFPYFVCYILFSKI